MVDIAASVIARLKLRAQKEGLQLQLLLNLFCQEEFLRRVQKSKYTDNIILKGGFLMYSLSKFSGRPTMDADYMLKNYSNNINHIKEMIEDIINSSSENDFIKFEIRRMERIAEHREYNGIRANILGIIKNTKTPFVIDCGVGDIITPSPLKRTLPVILTDFKSPEVLTYPLESVIAEKFDAIISRMELTGRMKDFFDIYYIASRFDFESINIQEALFATLENRKTFYSIDSLHQVIELANNGDVLIRWKSFCKKTLKIQLDFRDVLALIEKFIGLPFEAILNKNKHFYVWKSSKRSYFKK